MQLLDLKQTDITQSRFYQEIRTECLEEGRQEGRQEGLQEGEQRGRQEGQRKIILLLLNHKFDGIESPVLERINRLSNDLKPQVDIQNGNQLDV
ncbi:DUF4351 domain-containing protein [Cylindrospermopsis raciborskii]|uniref:DUF4351 domain-containing protein n=1 Tax=Cylindrospermopsis raciborskii TaxID=77022 RepID=UPI001F488D25|nr:DUF4351 domain-containing protein [Cylindrospermopsis raciborskii]UJS05693.1 hypothetical protein L3I90_05500 [Cylindrospermopsis raciborskii KLL07]